MIRMLSGLAAPVIGGLVGLFRKDEKLSAYRIVLATTTTVGWGLWAGWVQWVILGQGVAGGGFAVCFATFLARWAMLSWVCGVLLASLCDDLDEIMSIVPVMLMLCAFGTLAQGMYTHDVFTPSPRTHYRAVVSCEHCGQSCYVNVKLGESWTDWDSVVCCHCGIEVPPEMAPEYAESREAWGARIRDGGGDGAQD